MAHFSIDANASSEHSPLPRLPANAGPALRAAWDTGDRIRDIIRPLNALEAIEQLVTLWKAGSAEDLSDVDRNSLGWLLTIVNVDLRNAIEAAERHAESVCQILAAEAEQSGGGQ